MIILVFLQYPALPQPLLKKVVVVVEVVRMLTLLSPFSPSIRFYSLH